jgi:hypothetical protein
VHFILIKPVFIDHLSYVTLFQCSPGRSHKNGLSVYLNTAHTANLFIKKQFLEFKFLGEKLARRN